LAEFGLFNGLHRIQVKILFPCHNAAEISQIAILVPALALVGRREARAISGQQKILIMNSLFPQEITSENLIGARRAFEAPGHCEAQD
jgi:hypothetical protein